MGPPNVTPPFTNRESNPYCPQNVTNVPQPTQTVRNFAIQQTDPTIPQFKDFIRHYFGKLNQPPKPNAPINRTLEEALELHKYEIIDIRKIGFKPPNSPSSASMK